MDYLFSGFSVLGYTAAILTSKESCSYDSVISIHMDFNLEKCKELCDTDEKCRFFFIDVQLTCVAYESCNDRRQTNFVGTTFGKYKGNLLVLQHGDILGNIKTIIY